ncbi:hypothetical protein [Dietzia sp. SYD-A1]|uniref:COG1470 family protein n=1 Tax=Dietzia sp. SYD-A1 TaxID=2780141 RepID=UPI001891AC78|nr:hypothetical protein [Dietzia sp. SYD-A1]
MRSLSRLMLALMMVVPLGLIAMPAQWAHAQPDGGPVDPTGSIRISLMDIPADRVDDPRARSYIVDNIPPGESISRRVQVTNDTGAPATLDVYAGPAEIRDGAFVPRPRGETNPLSSWVELSADEVTLDNGQSAEVLVTITVPEDAPEVEQYGAVWVSTRPAAAEGEEQIQQVSRVGVRLYVSVGEGNGPPSDFQIESLTPQRDAEGNAAVAVRVQNTGGRAVDVSGDLTLGDGPGGLTAQAMSASTVTIPPGDGGEVMFVIPSSVEFPAGPWQATADLESGWAQHSISSEITFPDQGVGETSDGDGGWPIGLWGALIAGLLAATALALILLRRRSSGGDERPAETH